MNHYDNMQPQYPDSFTADSAAAEPRYPSQLHPHPLFTRQGNALSSPFTSWHNPSYPHFPTHSPFPAPRLSPPPIHYSPINFKSPQTTSSQNQLAGSLDPSTGIFYRTPEHPRLRTAQACEKCRTRKAKCSGEHPTCKRCLTRGLICEYAKEGRVRGPNKAKSKQPNSGNDASTNTPITIRNSHTRIGPRGRTSSANSSVGSSEHPDTPGMKISLVKREQDASPSAGMESAGRNSLSLGEHRSSRPRPPDLQLVSASSGTPFRSSAGGGLNELVYPPYPPHRSQGEYGQHSRQVRSMHQPQMSYHQQSLYQLHRDQHMHPQKNMTVIQPHHSQGQPTPSSSSPQGRLMPHTQTDHLMNLGMPYNVSPLQSPSLSEEFMYPSAAAYLQQHHSFPQYTVGNVLSNPMSARTSGSSPHTSVSGGTSTINSPLTPASAPPFVISPSASRIGMKMDLDMNNVDPVLHGQRSGGLGGPISLEPVWIDHLGNAYSHLNSNSGHPILGTDERGQNDLSTQMGVVEGSIFVKNDQSHPDAQQDHFLGQSHDQSQSHNETQHYSALDLQMC